MSHNARNQVMLRAIRDFQRAGRIPRHTRPRGGGLVDLDLPREATIDPYSGEPLKLKQTDDGWLIYSVMQNGVDDGGDFTDLKDHGLAPAQPLLTSKCASSADDESLDESS